LAFVSASLLIGATTHAEDPLPLVQLKSSAPVAETPQASSGPDLFAAPQLVLDVYPLHEFTAVATIDISDPATLRKTLRDAIAANDQARFNAALARAKAVAETLPAGEERNSLTRAVSLYSDLQQLWNYASTDQYGAFFDEQSLPGVHDRLASRYPGYGAYIAQYTLTDDRGRVLYPTAETRTFLLRQAGAPATHTNIATTHRTPTRTPEPKPAAVTPPKKAPATKHHTRIKKAAVTPKPTALPVKVAEAAPKPPAASVKAAVTPKPAAPSANVAEAAKPAAPPVKVTVTPKPAAPPVKVAEAAPKPIEPVVKPVVQTPQPIIATPQPPAAAQQPSPPATRQPSVEQPVVQQPPVQQPSVQQPAASAPPPDALTTDIHRAAKPPVTPAPLPRNAEAKSVASSNRTQGLLFIIIALVTIGVMTVWARTPQAATQPQIFKPAEPLAPGESPATPPTPKKGEGEVVQIKQNRAS
jgi:hypothetical protein